MTMVRLHYAAPKVKKMSYEDQIIEFVKRYSKDGENNLLVKRLSEFLNDAATAKVLEIIETTCMYCYNGDETCYCQFE